MGQYELKMEVWNSDFDKNSDFLLDCLNLMDTAENREILKRNGLQHVDISVERDKLKKIMMNQDASKVIPRDNAKSHRSTDRRISRVVEHVQSWRKHKHAKYRVHQRRHSRHLLGERARSDHIHTGRNNTKYVDALLTMDEHLCLLLKHITNLVEY